MPSDVAGHLERLVTAMNSAQLERDAITRRAEMATNRIRLLRSMQTMNAIHHALT